MTASSKLTWGIVLEFTGLLLLVGGIALSFVTMGLGACLGIPMALVGLPMLIWGAVWTIQGIYGRHENAISRGIQRGLAANAAPPIAPPTAPVPPRQ